MIKKLHKLLQNEFGYGNNRPYYKEQDFYAACLLFSGLLLSAAMGVALLVLLYKVSTVLGLLVTALGLIVGGVKLAKT